jgi:nucleoside-diphosphate-sugar epimerase
MIAVTGGTGLVGAHLLLHLLKKGEKVKALKRKNSSIKLVEKVFSYYCEQPEKYLSQVIWTEGDILDYFSLEDAFEDVNKVYHCAAMVSFESEDKSLLLKTNIEGTANVVNVLLKDKTVKLCHVSSIGALGRASDSKKMITEKTHFSSSVNPSVYSLSKYESEREVWRGIIEGLNAVIVNPSVIIGPGDWNKGSSKLFQTVFNGLKYYTGGVNGFVDVNDLVKIMITLTDSSVNGEQFIVNSENVPYKQIFEWIAQALMVKPPDREAGRVLSELAWRILKIKKIITGKKSSITKETAKTARQIYKYDNTKLLNYIDFKYTPVKETVYKTAEFFLNEN